MTYPPQVQPVSLAQFCERFDLRTASGRLAIARGRQLIKRFRTMREGKQVWTTEEWLIEGVAEQALPPIVASKRRVQIDPMRAEVVRTCVELLRDLAAQGVVRVYKLEAVAPPVNRKAA